MVTYKFLQGPSFCRVLRCAHILRYCMSSCSREERRESSVIHLFLLLLIFTYWYLLILLIAMLYTLLKIIIICKNQLILFIHYQKYNLGISDIRIKECPKSPHHSHHDILYLLAYNTFHIWFCKQAQNSFKWVSFLRLILNFESRKYSYRFFSAAQRTNVSFSKYFGTSLLFALQNHQGC